MTWKVELVSRAAQPTGTFETLEAWNTGAEYPAGTGTAAWAEARFDITKRFRETMPLGTGYLALGATQPYIRTPSTDTGTRELTQDEMTLLTRLVDEARGRLPPVPLPPDTIRVTSSFHDDAVYVSVYEGKTVDEVVTLIDASTSSRSCRLGAEIQRVATAGGLS